VFFSAAGRPVEPLSFSFGLDRGHAHSCVGEDGAHHRAGDGHLGQFEGEGVGVTRDYILISLRCRLVNDQSAIAMGSSMRRGRKYGYPEPRKLSNLLYLK